MAERKGFSFGLYLQVANDARVDVRATLNVHKLDDWILASARDRPSIRTDEWQRLKARWLIFWPQWAAVSKLCSKLLLFGALELYLSEKQMPQVVGFIRSRQNQESFQKG
jgi:hypothetical protein